MGALTRIFDDVKKLGVRFEVHGDSLKVDGRLPSALLTEITENKPAIIAALNGDEPSKPTRNVEPYRPFPTDCLPSPIGGFVTAAARAIGCDESFIAVPQLCCLAEAIGNRRTIRLKRTWSEPAVLWGGIVANSGQQKTPAVNSAVKSLQRRQAAAIAEWKIAVEEFSRLTEEYERNHAKWKRGKSDGPPPWKPEPPVCRRFMMGDTTTEALCDRLEKQSDGVLVVRDELAGFLDGMGEYKAGKGSDTGHWLSFWSASEVIIDRKSGRKETLVIPRAAVSIVGGIQPAILRRAIGREHRSDGLCARLLLVMPPPRAVRWTDATVSPEVEQAIDDIIGRLLTLEPAADEEGQPMPYAIPMDSDAKKEWVSYYNRHRKEQADLDDDLSAAWSKLEAYTARFALVFQLTRWAYGAAGCDEIDAESMTAAIILSDWFANEARRVYGLFEASELDDETRKLFDWLHRRGGSATAREVQQCCRWLKESGEAEKKLEELVSSGLGTWEQSPPGQRGQPTRVFRLSTVYSNTENPDENTNTVGVDSIDVSRITLDTANDLFLEAADDGGFPL